MCSKYFYEKIPPIKENLEQLGHEITLPNSFEDAFYEEKMKAQSKEDHISFKQEMYKLQNKKIAEIDGLVVLNFEKNGQANYIGGATFMEISKAWELGKKLFFYNPIPESILTDELIGFDPIIINGNLSLVN